MEKLGVEVNLGTALTADQVTDMEPDAVIVATGAGPGMMGADVKGEMLVIDLFTAFDRPADEWRQNVMIVGGDIASSLPGPSPRAPWNQRPHRRGELRARI